MLRGGGYDVEQVATGTAAWRLASRARPGLVLLDWRLPNEPAGSALVRKLRDACGTCRWSVLSADPQSLPEAREAQVSDYLPKPFDVNDLLRARRRALRLTRRYRTTGARARAQPLQSVGAREGSRYRRSRARDD